VDLGNHRSLLLTTCSNLCFEQPKVNFNTGNTRCHNVVNCSSAPRQARKWSEDFVLVHFDKSSICPLALKLASEYHPLPVLGGDNPW